MDDDKERMQSLMPDCVNIGNMHYGQKAALKERELEAAVDTMSCEQRNYRGNVRQLKTGLILLVDNF